MKNLLVAFAATAMLIAGSARADHCDADVADVQLALSAASGVEDNAFDAAEALLEHAQVVCSFEEEQLATAEADSPMTDPDYISVGQSMLINAVELLTAN